MPKKYEVEITNVDQSSSKITVKFAGGSEGEFTVVAPAKIQYAKPGPASVTLDGDTATYVGRPGGSTGSSGNTGGFKPTAKPTGKGFSEEDQRRIVRQHTQKVAIETMKVLCDLHDSPNQSSEVFMEELIKIAHQLEEDIYR